MSLNHNPAIVTNGLVLSLDATNRKSFIAAKPSLINTNSWTVGSGSVAGYGMNGNTGENTRLYDTDPWGNQSIVWGTYASGDSGADGGWNSDFFNIDRTRLYRFSVWVRRTSSTSSGTFYFGTGAGGADVVRTDNSTTINNAYWECTGTSALTQNQWYLVCGHIYPYNTTYTGRHPNSGYFTVSGGTTMAMTINGCNIGQDLKWDAASVSSYHRTYHFYCSDATTRLQFANPRVDICDGLEPSISDLLTNGFSIWKDLSGNGITGNIVKSPVYANGGLTFNDNASGNVVDCGNPTALQLSKSITIDAWVKPAAYSSVGNIVAKNGNSAYRFRLDSTAGGLWWYVSGNAIQGGSVALNTWAHVVVTGDAGGLNAYINGVSVATTTSRYLPTDTVSGNVYVGAISPGSETFNGVITTVKIYNRALSAIEIKQNFNALRGRYGL